MINGTLFAREDKSIAREEPSAENDAAWQNFERVLTHVVTREEIIKLGKDPETVARFDDDYWKLGNDAYMVQLDVMHVSHAPRARTSLWTTDIGHSKFTVSIFFERQHSQNIPGILLILVSATECGGYISVTAPIYCCKISNALPTRKS
jgi:hypothetical protein